MIIPGSLMVICSCPARGFFDRFISLQYPYGGPIRKNLCVGDIVFITGLEKQGMIQVIHGETIGWIWDFLVEPVNKNV